MKRFFFVCLALFCLGGGLNAQTDTLSNITLAPITIISLRSHQTEAGSERLKVRAEDRLAHDPGAFLGQVPMISGIRKSGSYGFDPVLRGFKYDQLNIVMDGVLSATAACPNRMDPPVSQIPLNQIKKVEIYTGPHSLRYGVSSGGTIHFVSEIPHFSESVETSGRLASGFESNGNLLRTEAAVGVHGNRLSAKVFGTWSQGDDYKAGNGEEVAAGFRRGSFSAQIGLKPAQNQQFLVSATRNIGRDVDFPALPMDLRDDDTWLFNLRHEAKLAGKFISEWQTSASFSYVDHLMDNLSRELNPRMLNAETHAETYTYGGRTELKITPNNTGTLFLGLDFRGEEALGIRTRSFLMGPMAGNTLEDNAWQHGRIHRAGVFSEYHFVTGILDWTFSARLDYNRAEALNPTEIFERATSEIAGEEINPSLSIGFMQPLTTNISWGMWLGRSQRSGSLTERFINYFPVGLDPYELVGNPNLKPEANQQVDVRFQVDKQHSSVQISGFTSYLTNFITSEIRDDLSPRMPMSPGVRQFVNRDAALLFGGEIRWEQLWHERFGHELMLAYTFGQDVELGEPLPEIAPLDLRLNLRSNFLDEKLSPEIGLRYVAQQARISEVFGETITPSFITLDIVVRATPFPNWTLSAGVRNLLDEAYYEHLNRAVRAEGQPPLWATGRNTFLRLSWRW